jgi:hypothetical protein
MSLGLKVTSDIKARLDAAAQASGRTQSQEAEVRLERSFERQDLLSEVLSQTYARPLAGLLLALGTAMTKAGLLEHWARTPAYAGNFEEWLNDPTAFNEAVIAAKNLLNAARPQGHIEEVCTDAGNAIAKVVRNWARLGCVDNPFEQRHLSTIRSLLGPLALRMAQADSYSNPFPLSMAVLQAYKALERFQEQHKHASQAAGLEHSRRLPPEPVAQILERCLGKFLISGWDQCSQTGEVPPESEEVAAEIRRLA